MENKENQETRGGHAPEKDQKSQNTPPKGRSWFFGIGINNYIEFSSLNNAVNDIEAIEQLLTKKYDIESDCTFKILNEDAIRENIIDQLDVLVKKVKAEDKLIIYYSGHGHLDKDTDRGYWIPHNAKVGKTAQYIRNSTIREFIKDLKARHVLLISDSCFSGTLFVRGTNRSTAAVDELEAIPSRWAICSGRHDEEVFDGEPGENSPFASSILETLSRNEKPVFNIAKLADYVVEQTRSNYKQLPEGNPLYDAGHKGGQYVFHLKKDEVTDWKECVEKRTIKAFTDFLVKYPDEKYASNARTELKSLKATELWQKIENAKEKTTIEVNKKLQLIDKFIEQYNDQFNYVKALDLGQLLEYRKQFVDSNSSEYGLRKFLMLKTPNVHGANKVFEEAERLLVKLELPVIKDDEKIKQAKTNKKTKEEEIVQQKVAAEKQRLKERNQLAQTEHKTKQQKEEALRKQQTKPEQKPKESYNKTKVYIYSAIFGLIYGSVNLIAALETPFEELIESAVYTSIVFLILIAAFIIYHLSRIKKQEKGHFSFGRAFTISFISFMIISVIGTIMLTSIELFYPGYYYEMAVAYSEYSNLPDGTDPTTFTMSGFERLMVSIFGNIIYSLIFSLIIALIMKSRKQ